MAYADFAFYRDVYYGDVFADEDPSRKWLERASDELDTLTFGRLTFAMPEVEAHVKKVKKAVCAMAEALYYVDTQRSAASAQQVADGSYRGAIASITAGKESVSYAIGGTATTYAAAAASSEAQTALLAEIACRYISNIPDANGVNLLYAGGGLGV